MDTPALHLLKAKLCQRELCDDAPTAVSVSPELFRILSLEERHVTLADGEPALRRDTGTLSVLGVDVREDDRLTAFEFEE
jgi:hypothetical protein